jgi:hypothetical protein
MTVNTIGPLIKDRSIRPEQGPAAGGAGPGDQEPSRHQAGPAGTQGQLRRVLGKRRRDRHDDARLILQVMLEFAAVIQVPEADVERGKPDPGSSTRRPLP